MSHITYDRSKPFGLITAESIDAVITARNNLSRVKTAMDEVSAGGAAPANLEVGNPEGAANFGVPAGQGQNFYNEVVSVLVGLNAIAAQTLGDLDLGG